MDYVKTLKDIAIELVEDKEHLEVRANAIVKKM